MGYTVFLRSSLAAAERAVVDWLARSGMRRADRGRERIDRTVTLTESPASQSWIAVRDREHFDLGLECEPFAVAASGMIEGAAVAFVVSFDDASMVLASRGARVDVIEYASSGTRGRPELWAESLGIPELASALARAMRAPLTIEDDTGDLIERPGLDVYEAAVALGIGDDLFPSENEESTSNPKAVVARLFDMMESRLPYTHEPASAAESRREIDAVRSLLPWARSREGAPRAERVVTLDFCSR